MPFTFSHPALVLPFVRRKSAFFSVSGLLAGSLVPDFEYFLYLQKDTSRLSHSLPGLVLFDWPIGLLVCFLFHLFLKYFLLASLPLALYQRLQPFSDLSLQKLFYRHFLSLSVSILLGAAMHLAWDWGTHQTADLLSNNLAPRPAANPALVEMKRYYIVWFLYSAAGLFFLWWTLLKLPQQNQLKQKTAGAGYWLVLLGATGLTAWLRMRQNPYYSLDDRAVIVIACFLCFLLLVAAVWQVVNSRR